MDKKTLKFELQASEAFFMEVFKGFHESEAGFAPQPEMFTVAIQAAHVGQTVAWFVDGATSPNGFDMNFEMHAREIAGIKTLAEATRIVRDAYAKAITFIENSTDAQLAEPLPQGFVMPGQPKFHIVFGIVDHTAHHRGALTAYARALGKVPVMPYMASVPWEA